MTNNKAQFKTQNSELKIAEGVVPYSPLIRDIPLDDRPRERLEKFGPERLQDVDLLAIILGTGAAGMSALQLAQHLVQHFHGLRRMDAASIDELSEVHGIGPAKACQLKAAFTLGKRLPIEGRLHPRQTPRHRARYPPRRHLAGYGRHAGDGGIPLLQRGAFQPALPRYAQSSPE